MNSYAHFSVPVSRIMFLIKHVLGLHPSVQCFVLGLPNLVYGYMMGWWCVQNKLIASMIMTLDIHQFIKISVWAIFPILVCLRLSHLFKDGHDHNTFHLY